MLGENKIGACTVLNAVCLEKVLAGGRKTTSYDYNLNGDRKVPFPVWLYSFLPIFSPVCISMCVWNYSRGPLELNVWALLCACDLYVNSCVQWTEADALCWIFYLPLQVNTFMHTQKNTHKREEKQSISWLQADVLFCVIAFIYGTSKMIVIAWLVRSCVFQCYYPNVT